MTGIRYRTAPVREGGVSLHVESPQQNEFVSWYVERENDPNPVVAIERKDGKVYLRIVDPKKATSISVSVSYKEMAG